MQEYEIIYECDYNGHVFRLSHRQLTMLRFIKAQNAYVAYYDNPKREYHDWNNWIRGDHMNLCESPKVIKAIYDKGLLEEYDYLEDSHHRRYTLSEIGIWVLEQLKE